MIVTLRRVEPMSLAKIYAVVTGAILLVFALPAGCGIAVFGAGVGDSAGLGAGVGLLVALVYPVVGVVMGFIAGYIYAAVYNLVADRMGGVELEFDELDAVSF